ncbi:hypothetical protein NDU88_004579 [Pleurodeles waltl]|uniref:Uncharacterized protein n=1 Tax=Pleurodeles waltl TaxID=8319 RepID=A0AAV7QD54_PLEWA|nr:hypothetical protein NDU88_004579 [Pleurodeles waltl]
MEGGDDRGALWSDVRVPRLYFFWARRQLGPMVGHGAAALHETSGPISHSRMVRAAWTDPALQMCRTVIPPEVAPGIDALSPEAS